MRKAFVECERPQIVFVNKLKLAIDWTPLLWTPCFDGLFGYEYLDVIRNQSNDQYIYQLKTSFNLPDFMLDFRWFKPPDHCSASISSFRLLYFQSNTTNPSANDGFLPSAFALPSVVFSLSRVATLSPANTIILRCWRTT
jgi:hypothetical protein